MSVSAFSKKVNKGGFIPQAFIAEHMGWMKERASTQNLLSLISEYEENNIKPTVFLQSFSHGLQLLEVDALEAKAKKTEERRIEKDNKGENAVTVTIYEEVYDPIKGKIKENDGWTGRFETYIDLSEEKPSPWVQSFTNQTDADRWAYNKLNKAKTPRVYAEVYDGRLNMTYRIEQHQGDRAKTQKLGGNIAIKDSSSKGKYDDTDKPVPKLGKSFMRVKG